MAAIALVAASALAGCANNGTTPTPTTTTTTATPTTTPTGGDGDALILGTLLPLSGRLEAYGPDMQNATKLAVKHINAAGGVNGMPVEIFHEDDRTDATQAPNAMNNLVNKGVVAVVGAASSTVTLSVLPVAGDNSVILISPASTSPALTRDDDDGWFWRVPPSDALQGKVLAKVVRDDGHDTVAIMAENGAYGVGLGDIFRDTFLALGGNVSQYVKYEGGAATFTSQIQTAASGNPDAIVLIGYPTEGSQIMREAGQQGLTDTIAFYFSEGLNDAAFPTNAGNVSGKNVLSGFKGTTPSSGPSSTAAADFVAAYKAEYGNDEPGLFAAESYDAVWAIALAAQRAGSVDPDDIRDALNGVWNDGGTDVMAANATEALEAAAAGDVNYVGASNDFDWDDNGDPLSGFYAVWTVDDAGAISTVSDGWQVLPDGAVQAPSST